jgi:hypothetical protein
MLLILSAESEGHRFCLPRLHGPGLWVELVNTAQAGVLPVGAGHVEVPPHSVVLLRQGADRRLASDPAGAGAARAPAGGRAIGAA